GSRKRYGHWDGSLFSLLPRASIFPEEEKPDLPRVVRAAHHGSRAVGLMAASGQVFRAMGFLAFADGIREAIHPRHVLGQSVGWRHLPRRDVCDCGVLHILRQPRIAMMP